METSGMEKRFQVFVSSTYADLREERQKVIQTVMEMDCIPAGGGRLDVQRCLLRDLRAE